MISVRYLIPISLALLTIAPATALAQSPSDSVVVLAGDIVTPGRTALFGAQFTEGEPVGPLPLSVVEPFVGCHQKPGGPSGPEGEFVPLVENPEEVEGTIVLISRGDCFFSTKVRGVAEAGAAAAIVINNNQDEPDEIMPMPGNCTVEQGCSIPAAFVSYESRQALLAAAMSGTEAVIVPVRIAPTVAAEPAAPEGAFALASAFPNPTSARTTVALDLPVTQAVRVAVFGVLGREVAVLHDGPLAAGAHELVLDAARLPAGLYLVRASGEGLRATRKLVVTR